MILKRDIYKQCGLLLRNFSYQIEERINRFHRRFSKIVLSFLLMFSSISARGFDSDEEEKSFERALLLLPGVEVGLGATAFGGVSVSSSYQNFPWPIVWQQVGFRHYGAGGNQFQLQSGFSLGFLYGGLGWRWDGRTAFPFWTIGVPLFPIAFLIDEKRDWDRPGWPASALLFSSLWIERDLRKNHSTFVGFSLHFPVLWGKKSRTQKLDSVAN